MKKRELYAEVFPLIQEMPAVHRAWTLDAIRELLADIKADQVLAEALGPEYERLDPAAWRPSTLPPDCATWEEYEARQAAAI